MMKNSIVVASISILALCGLVVTGIEVQSRIETVQARQAVTAHVQALADAEKAKDDAEYARLDCVIEGRPNCPE